ncbi:hypothetical protein [Paraburkholderia monticola]|uniref:hypothetical protein n=1 Tax=Paraburkholderia monticola TaxID=1399968 RepID=UPI0012907683|nr:hypothetical protein [Paraburkholderia monticola]
MYEAQLSNLTARLANAGRAIAGMPEESRQAWLAAIEGEIDALRTEIERNQNVEPANRFSLLQQLSYEVRCMVGPASRITQTPPPGGSLCLREADQNHD